VNSSFQGHVVKAARLARRGCFRPLTSLIAVPGEVWILEGIISDLRRGGIDYCLVSVPGGYEIWRGQPRRRG